VLFRAVTVPKGDAIRYGGEVAPVRWADVDAKYS
jgi:hypothetical protein